ncbi:hypothetical protein HNY73_008237 [Argiope bruennichi]|uniref:Uncharacterized protein n=1 Tax=Argiope bruennichi TaxID=94029 RepID=A0A8T0FAT1_ARGBR|nr:hypothetical protein HNY73_008237 [Argiope bruennichi]
MERVMCGVWSGCLRAGYGAGNVCVWSGCLRAGYGAGYVCVEWLFEGWLGAGNVMCGVVVLEGGLWAGNVVCWSGLLRAGLGVVQGTFSGNISTLLDKECLLIVGISIIVVQRLNNT